MRAVIALLIFFGVGALLGSLDKIGHQLDTIISLLQAAH